LFFKPQGIGDYAASALLSRAWSMPYTCALAAAHLRHTCQLQNPGTVQTAQPEPLFACCGMQKRLMNGKKEEVRRQEAGLLGWLRGLG
jgi:hypothetical protein